MEGINNNNGKKKQTKGRQKIEMKKIENEDDRLITFSKRRSGIYKKASELATLCGAEVGIVVFSPAGKPFSFAHPCIETVANKFLNENPQSSTKTTTTTTTTTNYDTTHPLVEAHRRLRINELNQQHNQLLSQLDAEKEKGKALEKLKKVTRNNDNNNNNDMIIGRGWWETPTDELGIEELHQVDGSLGDLYQNVCDQLKERGIIGSSDDHSNSHNSMPFHGGDQEITIPFNILGNDNNGVAAAVDVAGDPSTTTYLSRDGSGFDYGQDHHHHHP